MSNKKQTKSGPNKENPRQALDALMGASVDFFGGKLKMSVGAQAIITRLGILDKFGNGTVDFADAITLAYTMFDNGDKERIYKLFRESAKGETEYTICAMRWADEKGISFANGIELSEAISKLFKAFENSSTTYRESGKTQGNA